MAIVTQCERRSGRSNSSTDYACLSGSHSGLAEKLMLWGPLLTESCARVPATYGRMCST